MTTPIVFIYGLPAVSCGSDLWRGGLPPFECAALTRSSIHRKFWGCFATQRGQAPSPQAITTGWVRCSILNCLYSRSS
ncbi:hypothetical protein CRX42_15820 [Pseudomonas jessenii]|uniref:Uncharacterized protein n=1 Tax=Pseudomonas jessenii TaxID=77298 RepID=A0A2W0EPJ0_PSEJE|nr:hypothetical protein CRX42_15820 [Pseudomonas jessenii]